MPTTATGSMPTLPSSARAVQDWSGLMASVARFRDRDSFMQIYDHFMPRMCLYLRGLGVAQDLAEELAQDALLRLWQHADRYDPARSQLGTWLFRIARNLHIDHVRKEPSWLLLQDPLDALMVEEERSGGSSAEQYAEHVSLQQRIDTLSPAQARLLRMSYFEAKSHQEIADELAMPLGTVKSHLRRAFLRLRDEVTGS